MAFIMARIITHEATILRKSFRAFCSRCELSENFPSFQDVENSISSPENDLVEHIFCARLDSIKTLSMESEDGVTSLRVFDDPSSASV